MVSSVFPVCYAISKCCCYDGVVSSPKSIHMRFVHYDLLVALRFVRVGSMYASVVAARLSQDWLSDVLESGTDRAYEVRSIPQRGKADHQVNP
jgi:hypothetical protein